MPVWNWKWLDSTSLSTSAYAMPLCANQRFQVKRFDAEIQNTSAGLQAKLLRVVEEGEVRPVGGAKPRRVDVRLIAACNVDLKEAVAQRLFRADFYYRLNRFPIALPPLREHSDDILPLARYFVQTLCIAHARPEPRIEPRVEAALRAYSWPGNIRELKNAIERAMLLTKPQEPVRWDALPEEVRTGSSSQPLDLQNFDAKVAEFERNLIMRALERNGGVVRRAAKDLEINAVTLARKMQKHLSTEASLDDLVSAGSVGLLSAADDVQRLEDRSDVHLHRFLRDADVRADFLVRETVLQMAQHVDLSIRELGDRTGTVGRMLLARARGRAEQERRHIYVPGEHELQRGHDGLRRRRFRDVTRRAGVQYAPHVGSVLGAR